MSTKPIPPFKNRAGKTLRRKPQRSIVISLRVNAEENDKYREEARKHQAGVSEWIRITLSDRPAELATLRSRRAAPIADPQLLCQLVRIWNDIDDTRRLILSLDPSAGILLRRRIFMIERHLRRLAGHQE